MPVNPQISTITIPALVIAFNHVQFIDEDMVVGKIIDVPCRDILFDNTDSWGIPVKDSGIFTELDFELKIKVDSDIDYTTQPTVDSFPVFRIRDKNSYNEWMIYGTKDDLLNSCATCCAGDPVPMPGTTDGFSLRIAPCQAIDITNTNGTPYGIFGLPTLGAGQSYFPYGTYNNVNLATASASGYANKTALLSFLNSEWTPFVWTSDAGDDLFATGGDLGDSLCVNVVAITASA